MKTLCAAIAALSVFMNVSPVRGDVIYLRGGEQQTGIITGDREDMPSVKIRTSAGELAIPRAKIDHIEKEAPALGYAHIGDQLLDNKRYEEAAAAYRQALELDKNNADVAAKLRQAETAISEASKSQQEQAVGRLDDI